MWSSVWRHVQSSPPAGTSQSASSAGQSISRVAAMATSRSSGTSSRAAVSACTALSFGVLGCRWRWAAEQITGDRLLARRLGARVGHVHDEHGGAAARDDQLVRLRGTEVLFEV